MPRFECTYRCQRDGSDVPVSYTKLSNAPCPSTASSSGLGTCTLQSVRELPDEPSKAGKRAGGTILGAAVGAIAVVVLVSNPAGWLIGAGAALGAGCGWFASS